MGLAVSEEAGSSAFPFFPFWRREMLEIWGGQHLTSKGVKGVLRSTCLIETDHSVSQLSSEIQIRSKFGYLIITCHLNPNKSTFSRNNSQRVSSLTVTVRLAEFLQRRERKTPARTRRKTAREMRGNASIRIRISKGQEGRPTSGCFTFCQHKNVAQYGLAWQKGREHTIGT